MESSGIKLILASASPRRKELLGHLGIPFEVVVAEVEENSIARDPAQYVREISALKGTCVYGKLRSQDPARELCVVSADTTVCLGQKIYAKPADREEARRFLRELSGKTHSVYTGVTVTCWVRGARHELCFEEESRVTFDDIEPALLERYLGTGDSLDKAGAYGIQGPSLTFISSVHGSYSNVVGFPLSRFVRECRSFFKTFSEVPWLDSFSR